MIPGITEVNFPSYATLHQATVTLAEMGDRTISTQVRIDGDIVPDFTGWELQFKGERFVLPIREPQAAKDNTTRNSLIDLTFYSWPVNEMKRYFFMSLSEVETGVAIADQYKASVAMPVENFVRLFNKVLDYYFAGQVQMDLFGIGTGIYSTDPVAVEINYTYIWDVLQKFHEYFGLRWTIAYEDNVYKIKVGYTSEAIDDHDFEYGYRGGLLRFERQVQDEDITNILLGRGGEKNLPYRYFKRTDEQNPGWTADPDAIPELANIYFDRIRDANFRWYVRGWMQNENRDRSWENEGYVYPTYPNVPDEYAYAYGRGRTDEKFNPVEYVKDDASIAKYGERWGALDDNDDIYPTIQGVSRDPMGRVDEVVDVSEIITDDIDAAASSAAVETNVDGVKSVTIDMQPQTHETRVIRGGNFTIPEGKTGYIERVGEYLASFDYLGGVPDALGRIDTSASGLKVYDSAGNEYPTPGLSEGTYYYEVTISVYNDSTTTKARATVGVNGVRLVLSDVEADAWKPTFDIWVKNIWETTQGENETDEAYAERVWFPILGDRVGNEAKIVFSDGFMAISEDYEFQIASYPVVDRSKMTAGGVVSEWKITLRKSDAEYDTTGLFIPNAQSGGKPVKGDHFFFTGIDMPNIYVTWAEETLHQSKKDELDGIRDLNPTWIISLDKVRVHTLEAEDYGVKLADRINTGSLIRITDRRFTNGNILSLYVQSVTYTWNEGDIVPNIEVVLSDKVVSVESPVRQLQGDMARIRTTYVKTTDLEAAVRRVATPLFLKKTGESDKSISPTTFASKVSSADFRQGDIGGAGWGHYLDGDDDAVLELDKLVVRKELRVNSLVANQISYVGGKQIISAASMECIQVDDTPTGYVCHFDQKQGSVANLFKVGDIAMIQVFDEQNSETRYSKRLVTAISEDSITLSKTEKDGNGVPQKGDVIVQYGSTNDTSRQYVIVRDVIGGGYERMIQGLTSVGSNGIEYYFAGRQNGSTPRWFVGDPSGQHASYQDGVLNIAGRLAVTTQVAKSDGTYTGLSSYLNNLQDQIDGNVQTWYSQGVPTLSNYPASSWTLDTDKNNHIGDLYYDKDTGKGYRFMLDGNNYVWVQISDEDIAAALALGQRNSAAIEGLEYLRLATNQGTLVEGGLVLTSLIQLGQVENGQFNVYSGINGIMNPLAKGNGIAAWYGGPMGDKEDNAQNWAKSLFRFDGSGYLASGNIGWDAAGSGHIPGIHWEGNNVYIEGNVKLQNLSGDSVTDLITAVQSLSQMFGRDADGNIYVKQYNGQNVGFYNASWISALGAGSGSGGGGGGADLPAVWQSLSNNEAPYANEKIDPHHLNIPVSQGSGTYVTGVSWDTTAGILYVTRAAKPSYAFSEITGTASASQLPNIESLTNFSTRVYDATLSRTKNHVLAAPSNANGAATFRALVASDIPDLSSTYQTKYGFTITGTSGKTYDLSKFVTSSGITSVTKGTATSGGAVTTSGGAVTIQFPTAYSLPLAASGTRGGIQIGYSANGKNYPVQLSSEKAYVNVPWTDTTYSAGTGLSLSGTTFSINSTYQGYISNGNTAYGWGNHANAGYLYAPRTAYHYADGFLVETDIATSSNTMFIFVIEGNSYDANCAPVSTRVQGYNYMSYNQMLAVSAVNLGGVMFGSFSVFCYNGHVCLWFKQLNTYKTAHVFCYTNADRQNHAASITNSAIPTSGVTRKVDVTPMNLYAPYNANGYLPLNGGTMANTDVVTNLNADLLDGYHYTDIINGNVASATKLQNTRTIWGQNFNGTANITGHMSYVSSMDFSGVASNAGHGGYLDFHYNGSTADFTSRLMESASGTLSINNQLYVHWGGNVGIGADASSSYKLYVSGAVHFTGATSIANTLKLSGTSKRIYFGDTYYIELDSDNQLHTNAPFYSDSWVSALGAGSGSGGGGGDGASLPAVWASLSGHTDAYKDTTIDWAHIKVNRSDQGSGNVVSEVALTPANDGKSATLTITKTNIAGYSWIYEKDVTTTIS